MRKLRHSFLIVLIGALLLTSSCSTTKNGQFDINHRLENLSEYFEPFTNLYNLYLNRYLSPNGTWVIVPRLTDVEVDDGRTSFKAVSTNEPNVILGQDMETGISLFDKWAPDESAFSAYGYEKPGICYEDRILIFTLIGNKLSTAVFNLPVTDCVRTEWSSDNEYLVVYQANTFYVLDKDGELIQDFSYEISDDVGMSFLVRDEGVIIFQDSEDKLSLIIKSIDFSNPGNPETINVIGDVKFTYIKSIYHETDTIIFLEEDNNKVWLYDSTQNKLSPTSIIITGDVSRVEIVGQENKICIYFSEDDKYYINIYDLLTQELEKSVIVQYYIGWYADFGGFLIWSGTEEDGFYEIVN